MSSDVSLTSGFLGSSVGMEGSTVGIVGTLTAVCFLDSEFPPLCK